MAVVIINEAREDHKKGIPKERRRLIMAMPIAPTPVLQGKEAVEFQKRLDADLNRPARLKETPKLKEARNLIKQYALRYKK